VTIYEQLVALENEGVPFVLVTLVDALGSTPQDAAAKMLVTAKGLHSGTVGGGKVEAAALKLSAEMLAKGDAKPRLVSWTLKGDVGMTCGGSVKFYFEPHFGPGTWAIAIIHSASPESIVPTLPDKTFLLAMTMGHATDRPVLRRALTERNFPFIGVIGSAAKAEILRNELIADGVAPERASGFHCPVGLDFGTNHPHEIAISIAAQLISERDRVQAAG